MKSFSCKDAGVNCDWTTQGETHDEILGNVSTHARESHGIQQLDQPLVDKVKGAIREIKNKMTDKSAGKAA